MRPVAKPLPGDVAARPKPKRRRRSPYRTPPGRPAKHGAAMLTRVLRTVQIDSIDRRSQVGVALKRMRDELLDQLGGDVTPAQRYLIETAAKVRIIEMATADYILRQETLVTPEHNMVPIVTKYLATVGRLTDLLQTLGLDRKTKDVPDLDSYLVELEAEKRREAEATARVAEEQVAKGRADGADDQH
jgi:hypothetical protein